MKAVNIFFIVLFVVSAALQYNDPDPYVWMPLYLYGAFLGYQALQQKYQPAFYYIGLLVYCSYAFFLFFDKAGVKNWMDEHHSENLVQTMKATKPWIEETREFFGLVLLIMCLILNMIWLSPKRRQKTWVNK